MKKILITIVFGLIFLAGAVPAFAHMGVADESCGGMMYGVGFWSFVFWVSLILTWAVLILGIVILWRYIRK